METTTEEYRNAILVIADDNGLHRVPIGRIAKSSRVIDMIYDDSPVTAPQPVVVGDPRQPATISKAIFQVALAVAAWHFVGIGGLLAYAVFALWIGKLVQKAHQIVKTGP